MKISVRDYAIRENVSVQTIYNRIKAGKLQTEESSEGTFIILNENYEQEVKPDQESKEVLLERIKQLEERLKEAANDKEDLKKQVEQSNILQLKTIEAFKQLEYKQEKIQEELLEEKKKTWWQKLLKK